MGMHFLLLLLAVVADCFPVVFSLSNPVGPSTQSSPRAGISLSRRNFFQASIPFVFLWNQPSAAIAAETVGKDENCNDSGCLGVWDGLLADCPHDNKGIVGFGKGAGCTSSQDDTPGIFSEPWDYSDAPNNSLEWEDQMRLLVSTIELSSSSRGGEAQIVMKDGRYLRTLFTDGKTGEKSIGEFYFTPDDTTVQFRVSSLGATAPGQSLRNMERCEIIRRELRYSKVPVLRNRRRSLFFVESDLDTFGPGSAALGPPAEMRTGEIDGRQDVDPKLRLDTVQMFPITRPSSSR